METSRRLQYFISILLLISITGCNVTRNLPANEYLLTANKIHISDPNISSDDLSGYLQQTPNSKLFSIFRPNIAFYNLGSKGKGNHFKKWLRTRLGSAPVLMDTTLINVAKKQMGLYLDNKGYFKSEIRDSIVKHKKKAKVFYIVKTSRPYTIRNITFSIPDKQISTIVLQDTAHCKIRKGKNYDAYLLDDERTRIASHLQDCGYYRFSTNFIVFRIDSSLMTNQMDINIEITNPVIPSFYEFGSFMEIPHQQYYINKIYIEPQYNLLQADTIPMDTLVMECPVSPHDTVMNRYYFLYRGKLPLKPGIISRSIFIEPGKFYNTTDVTNTYSMLSRLGIFQYINIQFKEPQTKDILYKEFLDSHIQLTRVQNQTFSISTDGTNSGGAFGLQANFTYLNRNIFRGAQLLRLNFNASAQAQASIGTSQNKNLF
ncbi:MAG: hypothetical protein Q8867_11520, partial [Bacteroidota bacterium]|nr:hypothetical protein [Bacteroidota bacterium]